MIRRDNFPPVIYVCNDQDSGGLLVVGVNNDLAFLDASNGQQVAIYERREVRIYRTHPQLDPLCKTAHRKESR